MPRAASLLLLLLCAALASAANPKLKIGGVLATCGASAGISIKMAESLQWWAGIMNNKGGLVLNGTQYDLEVITYNDAFDVTLRSILYERLVTVDKVDALLGPFGGTTVPAFAVAQAYKIPVINIGDFGYYTQPSPPNGTFGGWAFSALPPSSQIVAPCYTFLKAAGAATTSSAWASGVQAASFVQLATYTANLVGLTELTPTLTIDEDLGNVPEVVRELKQQDADVFSGSMFQDNENVELLTEMYQAKYFPKAVLLWVGPAFESFRTAAKWLGGSALVPAAWAPSLNFKDPDFGSSQGLYDAFKQGLNRTPDTTDVFILHAATALKFAWETADSADPDLLRQALLTLNNETWFGVLNFSKPGNLQQTTAGYYCFQANAEGTDIQPLLQQSDLVYPAVVNVPDGFYKKVSHRARNIALGVGLGVGIPLIVAILALVYYIAVVKYQVLFIPKAEDQGEW